MSQVAERLQQIPGSRHVIRMHDGARGVALVTADLADDVVDRTLEQLDQLGVPRENVVLVRLDSIGPSTARHPLTSVVWADLLSQAGVNARPLARYLVFMAA